MKKSERIGHEGVAFVPNENLTGARKEDLMSELNA